tara:strand:- start:89 stop:367 length:279 start_codon:yes stop_codon:yes gene_type:complete
MYTVYIFALAYKLKMGKMRFGMNNKETNHINTEGYVTRRQLAGILNVSPRLITRLMKTNVIPHIRLSSHKHLYQVEAVRRAIAMHEVPRKNS